MKGWQLITAGALYIWAAIDYRRDQDDAMSVAFICYGIANFCFAWKQAGGFAWLAGIMARG